MAIFEHTSHTSHTPKKDARLCSLALYGGPVLLLLGLLLGIMGDPRLPVLLVMAGSSLFVGAAFLTSTRK